MLGLLLAGGVACDLKSMNGPSTGPGLEPPGAGMASGPGSDFGNPAAPGATAGDAGLQAGSGGAVPTGADPAAGAPAAMTGTGGMAAPNPSAGGSGTTGTATTPSTGTCADATRLAVEQEPGVMWPWEQQPTLTCRYAMPSEAIAYMPERVALAYTAAGVVTVVPHVADASACDPMTGGWYYDLTMNVPRIVVCPQSCKGEGAELVLGCPPATAP